MIGLIVGAISSAIFIFCTSLCLVTITIYRKKKANPNGKIRCTSLTITVIKRLCRPNRETCIWGAAIARSVRARLQCNSDCYKSDWEWVLWWIEAYRILHWSVSSISVTQLYWLWRQILVIIVLLYIPSWILIKRPMHTACTGGMVPCMMILLGTFLFYNTKFKLSSAWMKHNIKHNIYEVSIWIHNNQWREFVCQMKNVL